MSFPLLALTNENLSLPTERASHFFSHLPLWPDLVCIVLLLATLLTFVNCVLSLAFFTALRPQAGDCCTRSHSEEKASAPQKPPALSVLIPARNEEHRIGKCLESLSAQTLKNFEILVLDDNSDDNTVGVVRESAKKDGRIRLVEGKKLPPRWVGKNWACHQLAQHARTGLLLFTDADTVHHPHALESVLDFADKNKADMLSLWPRQITKTWSEWLVIPLIYVLILALRPQWMERLRGLPALGAANGQFIFFRREAYERIGGHKSVASHLVEDVALSRLARLHRLRTLNADGSQLVACRMYENFFQVWEGFTKNLRAMFDDNVAAFVAFGVLVFAIYVLPFFLLPVLFGSGQAAAAMLCAAQCCLVWAQRALLAARFLNPPQSVILHPIGQLLVLVIACYSWLRLARGGVSWKGRLYGGSKRCG